jgi:hypothetical protein
MSWGNMHTTWLKLEGLKDFKIPQNRKQVEIVPVKNPFFPVNNWIIQNSKLVTSLNIPFNEMTNLLFISEIKQVYFLIQVNSHI